MYSIDVQVCGINEKVPVNRNSELEIVRTIISVTRKGYHGKRTNKDRIETNHTVGICAT